MRRPFLKNKAFLSTLFILAVFLMTPHLAHAGWVEELVTGGIGMILEILILPLASAILALGGLLLDMAINFSLHTAYIFSLSPAINLGWTIVRDMCNLFFIFVLIYISLGTIVRGTSFGTKDLLTKVIIAALVINFSLFVTKAVVDVSNVFGLWLYGGIQNTLQANTLQSSDPSKPTKRASLSDLISARLGIINWMTGGSNATQNSSGPSTDLSNPSKSFIAKILRLAIVLIATYIFFYCAVLFISRSVTLLFLMVFSPVGFMGSVLPQLKDYASDWKKELTSAAMFPIAFLLMLYISLQFINSLGVLNQAQLTDETLIGGISVSLYFQYAIILFLLQACLSVAKDNAGKMGKAVGGIADGLGKLAVNAGVAVASGGSVLALRAGVAAATAKSGERWKSAKEVLPPSPRFIESLKSAGPKAALQDIKDSAKKAAKSGTWDIRNAKIPGVGKETLGSTLGSLTGVDISAAQTAKELKDTRGEWVEERKIEQKNQEILAQIRDIEKAKMAFEASAKTPADQKVLDDAIKTAKGKMSDSSSALSNKQLEKLNKGALSNEHFIQSISQSQAEHLGDKTEASDEDKAKVWKARLADVSTSLGTPGGDVKKAIKNHSDKELENLPAETLKKLEFVKAGVMDYEKFNSLMKSSKISNATKAAMKQERYKAFYEAAKTGNYKALEAEIKELEAPEIAKMDWVKKEDDGTTFDVLKNPEILYRLDTKTLGKMYEELSTSQLADIRSMIEAKVKSTPKSPGSDKYTHVVDASITDPAMIKRLEKTANWLLTNNIGKEF